MVCNIICSTTGETKAQATLGGQLRLVKCSTDQPDSCITTPLPHLLLYLLRTSSRHSQPSRPGPWGRQPSPPPPAAGSLLCSFTTREKHPRYAAKQPTDPGRQRLRRRSLKVLLRYLLPPQTHPSCITTRMEKDLRMRCSQGGFFGAQ